jgi:hypothetical protein
MSQKLSAFDVLLSVGLIASTLLVMGFAVIGALAVIVWLL